MKVISSEIRTPLKYVVMLSNRSVQFNTSRWSTNVLNIEKELELWIMNDNSFHNLSTPKLFLDIFYFKTFQVKVSLPCKKTGSTTQNVIFGDYTILSLHYTTNPSTLLLFQNCHFVERKNCCKTKRFVLNVFKFYYA